MAQKQIHFDDLEVKAHSVTLSATDGDVLLNRTEAGGDGSVIVSSGGIVAANNGEIPVITGDGEVGTSGKSFGATPTELQNNDTGDKVPTLYDLPFSWINFRELDLSSFTQSITTGSGSTNIANFRFLEVFTGETANSLAARLRQFSTAGWGRTNRATLNGTRRSVWHIRAWVDNWESDDGVINMICYGRSTTNSSGTLENRGFGWRIKSGSAGDRTLYALYSINGSAEVEIDTGFNYAVQEVRFLTIEVVGDGTINWYENGVLMATASDFGTAHMNLNYPGIDADNGDSGGEIRFRLQTFNVFVR